jgi:putative heme-binding domain-containing protein
VENHAIPGRDQVLTGFANPMAWEQPMTSSIIQERLIRRYAAEGTSQGLAACARLLESTPAAAQEKMLSALDQGLPAHLSEPREVPSALRTQLAKIRDELTVPSSSFQPSLGPLLRIQARLGDQRAREQALTLAAAKWAAVDLRVAMVQLIAEMADPSSASALLVLVTPAEAEPVQMAALAGLQSFPGAEVDGLLDCYAAMNPRLRARTRELFLSRKPWALEFLSQIDRGRFTPSEVPVEELRQVALLQDRQLDDLVRKHWGNITRGTPEEKLADVRRFNNDLRAFSGDPARGHELFNKTCGVCHRLYDEGAQIGPDLTHENRQDRDYLLVNIVDPSAVIRKEFLNYNVETADGRVLTGLIAEQSADRITILAANNERTSISRDQIKALKESPVSLMPEGLLNALKPQELRDLFAYLQSTAPATKGVPPIRSARSQ